MHFAGTMSTGCNLITLSGVLTTSSASSPVTSSTRTLACSAGSGTLQFTGVATDSGTPQYSKNAGAYSNITEGLTLAVANGDTIAVKAILPSAGNTASFFLKNNANSVTIEAVTLTKL